MRAFQLVEWQKPPELREVPVPRPGPGEVLVKVAGAGACHSDLHMMHAAGPAPGNQTRLPFTLGHENAGWVETLGPGVAGFVPGDPVIVYGPWGCGLCLNCRHEPRGEHWQTSFRAPSGTTRSAEAHVVDAARPRTLPRAVTSTGERVALCESWSSLSRSNRRSTGLRTP
ncbi:alcohol dehydrogenase catalytic domain-containing protein [Actinopolymorpha singaporensis]